MYLDQEQHHRLSARARDEGTTTSDLIRRAVDGLLAGEPVGDRALEEFRGAVAALTREPPIDLPPGEEYVDALRAADAARLDEDSRRADR